MKNGQVYWPPEDLMTESAVTLGKIMKGVTPLGDFWMMNKLKNEMTVEELLGTPKKAELLKAAMTINRFKSLERI